VEGPVYAMKT